jgi:hypothetical protein
MKGGEIGLPKCVTCHVAKPTTLNELKLPRGSIGKIKNKYRDIQKDVKSAFQLKDIGKTLDKSYYLDFKNRIKTEYPEYEIVIDEIEKQNNIEEAETYLNRKLEEIKECGKPQEDFRTIIITKSLETYVLEKKSIPLGRDFRKRIKAVSTDVLKEYTESMLEILKEDT